MRWIAAPGTGGRSGCSTDGASCTDQVSGRTGFVVILAKCPTRRILRTPIVRIESGAGSELYRGLAAVIVVCMSVSAAFTLLLLPSLLRIGEPVAA